MVSRIFGVMRLERDIQLNRCARQRSARLQISSVCESKGTNGAVLPMMVGVVLGGVRVREVVGVALGGVKAREDVGVARRCGECARPCDADVGVPKGDNANVCCEEVWEGGVCEMPPVIICLIGDTLGEGGGVGVTE